MGLEELSLAAWRLGRQQAEYHLQGERHLPYLRAYPAVYASFDLWRGRIHGAFLQEVEGFPVELRIALNGFAARAGELFAHLYSLPVTLCQGDVHQDNLIFKGPSSEPEIYLIDWDSAGYGYISEDAIDMLMEAFLYSERDISLLPAYKEEILTAYCAGAEKGGYPVYQRPMHGKACWFWLGGFAWRPTACITVIKT